MRSLPAALARPAVASPPSHVGRSRFGYLPALDGLRALAVIAVVLYHGGFEATPGGFLGVEIFFVISGYLVTSLLLAEWRDRGSVDLGGFWLRRVKRLVPVLVTVLAALLIVSAVALRDELAEVRRDGLWGVTYLSNWALIVQERPYFDSIERAPLLRHLWSLAIEGQFYLVWPPVLLVTLRFVPVRWVAIGAAVLAVGSAVAMAMSYDVADPSRVYYGTDTRAAGLLAGAALALVAAGLTSEGGVAGRSLRARLAGWSLELGALAGVALLVAMVRYASEYDGALYRGGFLLVAVATAATIAGVARPYSWCGRALAVAPLRWVGVRSYGIYLWHWPVMVLLPYGTVGLTGSSLLALQVAVTLGLSVLSYRCVEVPFRRGSLTRLARWFRRPTVTPADALLRGGTVTAAMTTPALLLLVIALPASSPPPPIPFTSISWSAGAAVTSPIAAGGALEEPREAGAGAGGLGGDAAASVAATPTATPIAPTSGPTAAGAPTRQEVLDAIAVASPPPPPPRAEPTVAALTPTATPAAPTATPEPSPSATPTSTPQAPAKPPTPPTPPAVVATEGRSIGAVGDSVMLGAAPTLVTAFEAIAIDAAVGRQLPAALDLLKEWKTAGALQDVVIVHIGNNGPITQGQFDDVMTTLADTELVLWVSLSLPMRYEDENNEVLAAGVAQYSNARLVDWHDAADGNDELFWNDRIHLRPEGAALYAELIRGAVTESLAATRSGEGTTTAAAVEQGAEGGE